MALIVEFEGKERTEGFKGAYAFLSSMFETPLTVGGHTFPTVEHAFQFRKSILPDERESILSAVSPYDVKRLGRQCFCRPDWEKIKISHMYRMTFHKFLQNESLRRRLLATENLILEEGNTWKDLYWGVDKDTRKGENRLGHILMKVRCELRKKKPDIPEPVIMTTRYFPVLSASVVCAGMPVRDLLTAAQAAVKETFPAEGNLSSFSVNFNTTKKPKLNRIAGTLSIAGFPKTAKDEDGELSPAFADEFVSLAEKSFEKASYHIPGFSASGSVLKIFEERGLDLREITPGKTRTDDGAKVSGR